MRRTICGRSLLHCAGYSHNALAYRAVLDRGEVYPADVVHNVHHIAVELVVDALIDGRPVFIIGIVGYPFVEMLVNVFQVRDTVIARLYGVVAEVFFDCARVVAGAHLLLAVTVNGIACLFIEPTFQWKTRKNRPVLNCSTDPLKTEETDTLKTLQIDPHIVRV